MNAVLKVSRRTEVSPEIVEKWIADNLNSKYKGFRVNKKENYLKNLIQRRRVKEISMMNPQEFNSLNRKDKVVERLNLMQSFYILLNAATSSNRNLTTAKVLIDELKYKSKGGIAKAIRSKILREKVYATVIKRKIKHEKNSNIKYTLIALKDSYEK